MTKKINLYKKKPRYKKQPPLLGLINKFRIRTFASMQIAPSKTPNELPFKLFIRTYNYVLNIHYIFNWYSLWQLLKIQQYHYLAFNLFKYYAYCSALIPRTPVKLNVETNLVVFSRPTKQLFLMIYKSQPTFIFTGGLMRKVINEKRKSSKKLYKVATSLVKLSVILLTKKNFFLKGILKIIDVGSIRQKILSAYSKNKLFRKFLYVMIKFRIDFAAQKLETRRAIKKYVKKRFKIY